MGNLIYEETVIYYGKESWIKAEKACNSCQYFKPVDEDEQVTDTLHSCYNYSFRRWTRTSFVCLKEAY